MWRQKKDFDQVIKEARINPQLMLELKFFPTDVMSREIGRSLTTFEIEVLNMKLQYLGIEKNQNDQHLLSFELQKKLQEQNKPS